MSDQSESSPVNVVVNIVGGLSSVERPSLGEALGNEREHVHTVDIPVDPSLPPRPPPITAPPRPSPVTGPPSPASQEAPVPSPTKPALLMQAPRHVSAGGFVANWQDDPEAHFYWLEVATDPDFAQKLEGFRPKKVTGNSTTISGLEASRTYYYRLRAEYESGPGSYHEAEATTADITLPTANHVLEFPAEGGLVELKGVAAVARRVPRAMTVELWIKPEVVSDFSGFVSTAEDTDTVKKGWFLGTREKRVTFGLCTEDGSLDPSVGTLTYLSSPKALQPGRWHHVAGTYDGDVMRLYIDGVLEGQSDAQSGAINYPKVSDTHTEGHESVAQHQRGRFVIGAFNQGQSTLRFQGKLTEVRLWNEARTEDEIRATMYHRLEPKHFEALVGYWRCDTGAGRMIHDLAGKLTGTMAEHARWADGDALTLYRPLDRVVKVVAGLGFFLALRADGTVWSWGSNQLGRLGDGTFSYREAPVPVRDEENRYLRDVKDIAAGSFHAVALKNDGRVYAWGGNDFGQLGDGSYDDSPLVTRVVRLNHVVRVACGANHCLALKNDGSVWAWGWNKHGQLGIGDTADQNVPVPVKDASGTSLLVGIKAISGGNGHSLALSLGGEVYAWGTHDQRAHSLPAVVQDEHGKELPDIGAIAARRYHSLALTKQGQIFAWGRNDRGQLGLGHEKDTPHPTLVKTVSKTPFGSVKEISAGYFHNLALKEDRSLWAWGSNQFGQLEDEADQHSAYPVEIRESSSAPVALCAGHHMSVVTNDEGRLLDWGTKDPRSILLLQCSRYHGLILKTDGTLLAWGQNNEGQLGIGTTDRQSTPMRVMASAKQDIFTDVKMISAGCAYSLAVKENGSVWAWGHNSNGNLGNNSTSPSPLPVPVAGNLPSITAVGAGMDHSVALDVNGKLWAWGYNSDGRCGDGSWTSPRRVPVQTRNLDGVVQIAVGWYHTVALCEDGRVWTFGNNWAGSLGDQTTSHRNVPVLFKGPGGTTVLSNIVSVAAGHHTTFVLTHDGNVFACGYNNYGQLGNLSTRNASLPVRVRGPEGYLDNIVQIAAGTHHVLARAEDGTVWAWGYNGYGQLGNNSRANASSPVRVLYKDGGARLSGIIDIAAGDNSSLALQDDGQVWTWGRGIEGLLANDSFSDVARTLPDKMPALSR